MISLSGASPRTPAERWVAMGITLATLALVALGATYLPWPRFTNSGWVLGLLAAGGGAAFERLRGGRGGPDITDPLSARRWAIGALLAQALFHMVGALRL